MNSSNIRNSPIMKCNSIFRMRFIAGLQYRAAAAAGVATQFIWGVMGMLLYKAFYEENPEVFLMTFEALSSYLWLQQAFLALFMTWFFENEIFQTITEGGIAYELCRPVDLYNMWFFRSFSEVLLCFSTVLMSFSLAEMFMRGFDLFSSTISNGEFDRILLRPRSILLLAVWGKPL